MSRLPWAALLVATLVISAVAGRGEDPPAGPYVGPQAPAWNRVHCAVFHRVGADGKPYGERELDPLLFTSSTCTADGWRSGAPAAARAQPQLARLLKEWRTTKEGGAASSEH